MTMSTLVTQAFVFKALMVWFGRVFKKITLLLLSIMLIKFFVCIIQKAALKYSNENYTLVLSCSLVGLHLHNYS